MIEVELPDGTIAEFPDTMKPEQITSVLQKQFPTPKPQQGQIPSIPDLVGQGMQQGFMPSEDPTAMNAPESFGQLAPIGRAIKRELPTLGFMGGLALGGPPGGVLGAGIGAGAQGLIGKLQGEPITPEQNLANIGWAGSTAGLTEIAGPPIAQGIQKYITSPLKGYTEKKIAESAVAKAAQEMVEQGVPISPTTIAPSRTARFVDWISGNLWPSNSLMQARRRQIFDMAQNAKNEFMQNMGMAGTSKEGIDRLWEGWVQSAGGPEATIPMQKTIETINNYLQKSLAKSGKFWTQNAPTFIENVVESGGNPNVQTLRNLVQTVNKGVKDSMDRTARKKIMSALTDDLAAYDAINGTNISEALQMAREASYFANRMKPLQNMLNRAKIPGAPGEPEFFDPVKFTKAYKEVKDTWLANKIYSGEELRIIDKFANQMEATVPDIAKYFAKNKPLGWQQAYRAAETTPGFAVAAYKYPYIVLPAGAIDYGLAYSMLNPKGIIRRLLTTGFGPPTSMVKVGMMKGLQEENPND